MSLPTDGSLFCSQCDVYNINPDNCFCDNCLQEIKENYLDNFQEWLHPRSNALQGDIEQYKTDTKEVKE